MCSKCYKACLNTENSAQMSVSGSTSTTATTATTTPSFTQKTPNQIPLPNGLDLVKKTSLPRSESYLLKRKLPTSESSDSCFLCRCEGLFCSLHRYADQHNCSFDYRKQGQDQIARDNPEVRCPKIRKI
ncbi:unnamed protein product [Hymenolepis diminuta]|uniref:AN1-type domain-containing protein n=1 Tax=Hymenolepis diminuta TaxID=6216 RepID=A0A0R3S9W0_HYMDI|nr:unnamed protein product [Hymenolepis diminuta]